MDSPFDMNSDDREPGEIQLAGRWHARIRFRSVGVAITILMLTVTLACDASLESMSDERASADGASVDPDALRARLADVRRTGDDLERVDRLASLVRSVDRRSSAILRLEVVDRSSTWRPFDRLLLLAAWAGFDGEAAMRWANRSAPKSYRPLAVELAMASWARADPEAARAGFDRDYASDSAATAGLIAGWLESDPDGLREYVEALDLSRDTGQHAIAVYVRRLIERDGTENAEAWAEDRASVWGPSRARHLYRQVASELTMAEPAAGVAFCERHCEGESGSAVRQMVATRWASRDPVATMEWLLAADEADPDERRYAVNAGYRVWLQAASQAAVDWALEQDPALRDESWFEPVVRRVSRSLGWKRATEALAWAESIARPAERERTQVWILKRWRARDEPAADAWLESSSMSEAAKREVRSATQVDTGA